MIHEILKEKRENWKSNIAPIDIRFHDRRHTHAVMLLKQNIHPKIVQERLGHSSISVTIDRYSHVIPSMQEDAVKDLSLTY